MDENEAHRKIAALTAIVQTMMHEVYSGPGEESGREWFDLQLEEDELVAMAIANELGEEELDRAFGWVEGPSNRAATRSRRVPLHPTFARISGLGPASRCSHTKRPTMPLRSRCACRTARACRP